MSRDRVEVDPPVKCCVCGHRTPRAQVFDLGRGPVVVGWCDFDWRRWVVDQQDQVVPVFLSLVSS